MRINASKFFDRLEELEELPELTMKKSYLVYRNETPIRSGNARNRTKRNGLILKSKYGYALRLDEGWSKQSPQGFSEPTIDYMEKFIKDRAGKI